MSYISKYVKYIKELDLGSRPKQFAFLTPSMHTTNIMTGLKHRSSLDIIDTHCENAFDCLYLSLRSWKSAIQQWLVIIYIPSSDFSNIRGRMNFSDRQITFTNLKKKGVTYWQEKCFHEDFTKVQLSNGETLKLWKTPYLLYAVTSYDKDFRKEWCDGYISYEGNEYGDTSTFYIIGCIDNF